MKKVALILASLLAIMLAGCGEGSSSAGGGADGSNQNPTVDEPVVVESTVDEQSSDVTTPDTPYNLSSKLGTPPGLPN